MNDNNVLKQNADPAFADILWSRPERADQAGKLVIIGGNKENLSAPMEAFSAAADNGAGQVTVVLPDVYQKQLKGIPGILFCESNNSGGLSKQALMPIIDTSSSADHILLPGSLANNSETTQLLEHMLDKMTMPMTITGDALDQILRTPGLINKQNITIVANPGQLQKIATNLKSQIAYKHSMPLPTFINLVANLDIDANLVTLHANYIWVKVNGKISQTKREDFTDDFTWQVTTATRASVFLMQHPSEIFQALTTAVYANH